MRVCVGLEFTIPPHAARRAMAAACRCPRGQQPIFPPFNQILSSTASASNPRLPYLLHPGPPNKRKRKTSNKLKKRKEKIEPSSRLLPQLHSSLARFFLFSHLDLRLTLPPLLGGRDLASGDLGLSATLLSRLGGGGDFQPLTSPRASSWRHRHLPAPREAFRN